MGNRASKAAGDQDSLNRLLAQLIQDDGKALSLDRLDDTTLLLQTALTTCIRAKERRVAWLCRICLDSEVTSCPLCRKKIADRHLFILS
eukprot:SM000016S01842  [mRNA]  locus=s16:123701:125184:- [translate_table: standard]